MPSEIIQNLPRYIIAYMYNFYYILHLDPLFVTKMHNIKKGILMKSLRVAFFGSLSGPDLIQSWELFAESKTDRTRIERCL